jgi:calnexin
VGTWAVEEPTVLKGMEGEKGLVVKDKAAHHAISAKFPEAIDNKDDTLVVQYEVKLQSELFSIQSRSTGMLMTLQMASSAVVLT